MLDDTAAHELLTSVFYSENEGLLERLQAGVQFAHYTSAETAMRIIQSQGAERAIWLRNSTEMNDFAEIEYGCFWLNKCLEDPSVNTRMLHLAQALGLNIVDLMGSMNASSRQLKVGTFLLSLSEHRATDNTGTLSMWRAYGGHANVCIVLKAEPLAGDQDAYSVDLVAVDYNGEDGFMRRITKRLDNIEDNLEALKLCNPQWVRSNWLLSIEELVLSTKDPGFHEEKEWRIIHRPSRKWSALNVPSKVVSVGGIVQLIHYLPFQNFPEHNLNGVELEEILDRIIIGPTPNPALVREAFIRLLHDANITDAERRVVISNIPLRRY
ncbi:Protein of unknown function [Sphingobium sp. AP50]|uniref:DUF2971 domain-containing protein n=1 Tax=Sphingobium sp. AP50 TaxID=1884369 RepID=UPI0008B83304|nr:DUF2971 domain-containing protein [Sphingobium sp. AP50]SEJ12765.1 Protein of unknown function [Sphingobium sp. AP50]